MPLLDMVSADYVRCAIFTVFWWSWVGLKRSFVARYYLCAARKNTELLQWLLSFYPTPRIPYFLRFVSSAPGLTGGSTTVPT